MSTNLSVTLQKLILLITVFCVGVISLIAIHLMFTKFIHELDQKSQNLQVKIQLGEYIVTDLYKIQSDFYELANTTSNKQGRELIIHKIHDHINNIKMILNILEKGGSYTRKIQLNITGHLTTQKNLNYILESNAVPLETIEIYPKINQLISMTRVLYDLIEQRDIYLNLNQKDKYFDYAQQIKRFYKRTPAYFTRMSENISRLLYEGELELQDLEAKLLKEKSFYSHIEIFTIALIILLVIFLGFIIAKQILSNNKKLQNLNSNLKNNMLDLQRHEKYIRGILDAQLNIVVVSDGTKMIDANNALVDFFTEYDTFDDFKQKHACICDYFIDLNSHEYIIKKDYGNGKKWYEYILEHPESIHKVAIYSGNHLHYFTITAKKNFIDENNFIVVISLHDITELIYAQTKLKALNDNLENLVNEKTNELKKLNESLEQRIKKEVETTRQRDKQLIQQSRFASMGEMIANIAHQWRQPLSAISSTVSSIQLQMQLNIANNKDIEKSHQDIMKYVDFLSHTIEDFRNFFKTDKVLVQIDIIDVIEKAINITSASYKNQQITIYRDIEENNYYSFGLPNELSQVFLNLLTNAKDALIENKIETKYLKIKAYSNSQNNIIEIQDNAGGIKNDLIDRIFDPYFTTKHQSQGTGIGLYISKDIIEKHLKGLITVSNKEFVFNGKIFKGACFKLQLPKI